MTTTVWTTCLMLGLLAADPGVRPDQPYAVEFPAQNAGFVRLVIHQSSGGPACIDELEVYGPAGPSNLARAASGSKATASSCLPGHVAHQIAHLNDGKYGNDHSWIAGGGAAQWAQIQLPSPVKVSKIVISRDREGQYRDRTPVNFEVQLSLDGKQWQSVKTVKTVQASGARKPGFVARPLPEPFTYEGLLRYAFLCERDTWAAMSQTDPLSPLRVDRPAEPGGKPYWGALVKLDAVSRVLRQFEDMIERLEAKGFDVTAERAQAAELRRRQVALEKVETETVKTTSGKDADGEADQAQKDSPRQQLYLDARLAKRRLFFRDPDLSPLQRLLFVKRHPYTPSHNYSDILDSAFRPGGGICVLEIPRRDGRLEPDQSKVTTLFDSSKGIARDAMADFNARRIYFAYRPSDKGPENAYWHLMVVGVDGSGVRQLSDGPFHDYYPCPLPDGGLAFISTRCKCRFLCWRPQAFVLFRADADGENITPLSHANLSEWAPSVMRDGRIIWTRSEYLDKGADFGHTLWAIRPDGTQPALVYGNDTKNCYMNGREVPGTSEICCSLVAHGGDFNGPLGLIDVSKGGFNREAVTNITPDVTPHYHMSWPRDRCFRDPVPVSRDYFLASHAPADRFGLYVVDRYGNRELLYFDPEIGSMCPTLLRSVPTPPVLGRQNVVVEEQEMGQFAVADVYQGLEPTVKRGTVKYLRVCAEVRSDLEQLSNGEYRKDHVSFQDFYATPIHLVHGPHGWPSYVAKTSLGLVPVDEDGSANFYAPANKVLYFEVLDGQLNELQRMRSVVQLQAGEKRSCIGCHESRTSAPPVRPGTALRREPSRLETPSWGDVAFSYEKVVQPVWNAKCVSCHDAKDKQKIDLSGTLGKDLVPASYRTLIGQGWVHHFNMVYGAEHSKAEPMSFGTVKSRLWKTLDAGHYDVKLSRDEMHRVKCWIDLNCPLWPDYQFRPNRAATAATPK